MLPIKGSVKKKSVPFVFPPSALLAQGIIHPWGAQYSRGQPGSRTVLGNNRTCQHLDLGPVNPTTTRTRISVLHTRSCLCITPCGVGFAMWSLLRGLPGTTYPSWPRTRANLLSHPPECRDDKHIIFYFCTTNGLKSHSDLLYNSI